LKFLGTVPARLSAAADRPRWVLRT
jgi:hypothetical protein